MGTEMNPHVSCTTLLEAARSAARSHLGLDSDLNFYAGFIIGQAEKVYLGTCPAAVFRIQTEPGMWMVFISHISSIYKLGTYWNGFEVWIYQQNEPQIVELILSQARLADEGNASAAHAIRAALCGIPPHRVELDWSPARPPTPEPEHEWKSSEFK